MNIFGSIVTAYDVSQAMENTIRMWAPDYLAEIAARNGFARDELQVFRSYVRMLDLDKFSEDQTPACVIICPGLASPPVRRSTTYDTEWSVGVGAVVRGVSRDNTYLLTAVYAAAIRALVLHNPSLGGFAESITWESERVDPLTSTDLRTIAAGVEQFTVKVNGAQDIRTGPTQPSVNPTVDPGSAPTINSVEFDIERKVG